MGKVGQKESDSKSNLVTEICGISSTLSNTCVHTKQRHSPGTLSPFIDWYRLLGVEEKAGIDVIRKRYHKLALQLHPDKNKHPKADIAFKLVSEAHACLTDNSKRIAFDLERCRNVCFECKSIPCSNSKSSPKHNNKPSHRFMRGLRDIRDRFREETKVIERCLRSNRSRASTRRDSPDCGPSDCLRRSSSVRTDHGESPVFDPSDYDAFHGYPHIRSRVYTNSKSFWYLQTGRVMDFEYRGFGTKCDSPIFEVQSSNMGGFKSRSACVHL